MNKKYILLEVPSERAPDLIEALTKRDYIKVISLKTEERKRLGECPFCKGKFKREVVCSLNVEMLQCMTAVAKAMKKAKVAVLADDEEGFGLLPAYNQERGVIFPQALLDRAMWLGLIGSVMEGPIKVHFLTETALSFMGGKAPLKPSKVTIYAGEMIASEGELNIDQVRGDDLALRDRVVLDAQLSIKGMPKAVLEFIEKRQMTLL